jgi:hypothetical protein
MTVRCRGGVILATLVAVPLLVAACSGGGSHAAGVASVRLSSATESIAPSPSTPPSPSKGIDALLAYARCMRAQGIADFPDPTNNPDGGIGFSIDSRSRPDLNPNNPTYQRANQACVSQLPGGAQQQASDQDQQREVGLSFARCMRAHGITDFPDPNPDGLFPETRTNPGKGSPQFTSAQDACQPYLNAPAPSRT